MPWMGVGVYVEAFAVGLRAAAFFALALAAGFRAAAFFTDTRFFMARNLQ
jgi:hypothetical protein